MRYDHRSPPTPTELDIIKLETIDLIRERLGLSEELAQRVVERSRSIDQAISLAELMR
jgi:hypothetical protein